MFGIKIWNVQSLFNKDNYRLSRALSIALTQPNQLSCLGSSVVEHLPSKRYVVSLSPV